VPGPARLEAASAAVLVLDLTEYNYALGPEHHACVTAVAGFLEQVRAAGVPIIFTGARTQLGMPAEAALKRRESEPLIYPDAYDKFVGGELASYVDQHSAKTLVITGGQSNMAVMYTATGAARHHHYQVYIPLDGVYSEDPYRYEYSLYQLTRLPGSAVPPRFTRLSDITFY
jgi:nicotinamidase-related amidase